MEMLNRAMASGERALNGTLCPIVSTIWNVDGQNVWVRHDRAFDKVAVQINRKQVYIRAGVRYRVSPAIHRYHFTPGTQAWKVTAFCMPAGLNVRERPEKGATPVARLSRGGTALSFDPQEDVVRDDKGNEWIHVKTPAGDSGWSMSLLREGATVTSLLVPVNYSGPGSQMVQCRSEDDPLLEVVEFTCGSSKNAKLTVTKKVDPKKPVQNRIWDDVGMLQHDYELTVDGTIIPPGQATYEDVVGSTAPLSVTVPEFRQVSESQSSLEWNGQLVVEYKVKTTGPAEGERWARFSDFHELHNAILSCMENLNKQQLASVPKPPAKTWTFGSSHRSDRFKNDRRNKLQEYMRALAASPITKANPYLIEFFALGEGGLLDGDGGETFATPSAGATSATAPAPEPAVDSDDDWM